MFQVNLFLILVIPACSRLLACFAVSFWTPDNILIELLYSGRPDETTVTFAVSTAFLATTATAVTTPNRPCCYWDAVLTP